MDPPRPRPVLGVERGPGSARDADPRPRSRLHARRDRDPERARRRERRGRVVAQRGGGHEGRDPRLGLRRLAPGGRRRRDRGHLRPAGRIRRGHREATLARPGRRRRLQLAAPGDARRGRPGAAAPRSPLDQRRAGRRQPALGAPGGAGCQHPAAVADRGWRRPGRRRRRHGRDRHPPPRGRPRTRRVDRHRALALEGAEALLQRLRRARGPRLRLRRQHPLLHRPRGRHAEVEGRALRPRPAAAAARAGPAAGAVGGGRAGVGRGHSRCVHRDRARPGDRGQDLEPPVAGRRRPPRPQRRGDGRVPAAHGRDDALSARGSQRTGPRRPTPPPRSCGWPRRGTGSARGARSGSRAAGRSWCRA